MNEVARWASALLVAVALVACAGSPAPRADAAAPDADPAPYPRRVLFVGNSYLYYNDSVHNHVRRLATELGPFAWDQYVYKSATISGARLEQHPLAQLLQAGRLGTDAPFDLVILQGGSAEALDAAGRARFERTVREAAGLVRQTGADLALYMTPAYVAPHAKARPGQIDTIATSYTAAAQSVDARLIPVGLAFDLAYRRRPDMALHKGFDGSHPSLLGSYLAACVAYVSLYGGAIDPQVFVNAEYRYYGAIDAGDARFLRQVALDVLASAAVD